MADNITAGEVNTSITNLLHDAEQAMAHQGVNAESITPELVVLATHDPGKIRDLINRSALSAAFPDLFEVSADEAKTEHANALNVHAVSEKLARPARIRGTAAALTLGVLAGAGVVVWIGDIKHDLASINTEVVGDTMMPGNDIMHDSSIMPGDLGHGIPGVGWLLRSIPGVPDSAGMRSPSFDRRYEFVPQTRIQEFEYGHGGTVVTPVSRDMALNGNEYDQMRQFASNILSNFDDDSQSIQSVNVCGMVNDEYKGGLGEENPEQIALSLARAEVAAQAIEDEAASRGIDLGGEPIIRACERVLVPEELDAVDKLAEAQGVSRAELIAMYNPGATLPAETANRLYDLLGQHRGVDISIAGTQVVEESVPSLLNTIEEQKGWRYYDDHAGELFFAVPAIAVTMLGSIVAWGRSRSRYVQRKAQSLVRRAGMTL